MANFLPVQQVELPARGRQPVRQQQHAAITNGAFERARIWRQLAAQWTRDELKSRCGANYSDALVWQQVAVLPGAVRTARLSYPRPVVHSDRILLQRKPVACTIQQANQTGRRWLGQERCWFEEAHVGRRGGACWQGGPNTRRPNSA